MTNSLDAFSNELKSLFDELQTILTNDLAATAKEADVKARIDALEKRITEIEKSVETLKKDVNRLNDSVNNFRTSIESNVRSQSVHYTQTVGSGNPQPAGIETPDHKQSKDQSGNSSEEVEISGPNIAGHKNAQNKKFVRAAFAVIDNNEYAKHITSSKYYLDSMMQADILITNALTLMQGDQAAIVAIQTCILIDLLNISFVCDKESDVKEEYKAYEKFIKGPNHKTFLTLQQHLQDYGLDEGTLSQNNLQAAIEGMVRLADTELQKRIAKVTNKKFNKTLTSFITSITQTINHRNSTSTQPAADSADQGPQS
jgi:hypothetical protein